jgi:hypothetical protein
MRLRDNGDGGGFFFATGLIRLRLDVGGVRKEIPPSVLRSMVRT